MTKHKKIYSQDFKNILNVEYTDTVIIRTDKLNNWDIYKDKEYLNNPGLNDKVALLYGALIDDKYQVPLYMQWINKTVEYGVFAEEAIARGQMICEYTGCLEIDDNSAVENLYLWEYPTILQESIPGKTQKKKFQFCVNAEKIGNFARGINHTIKKYQNVDVVMVPHKKLWHVIYRAKKDIAPGEQLLTHYGKSYWQDLGIVPTPLLP
jgi:hypothetical protein